MNKLTQDECDYLNLLFGAVKFSKKEIKDLIARLVKAGKIPADTQVEDLI